MHAYMQGSRSGVVLCSRGRKVIWCQGRGSGQQRASEAPDASPTVGPIMMPTPRAASDHPMAELTLSSGTLRIKRPTADTSESPAATPWTHRRQTQTATNELAGEARSANEKANAVAACMPRAIRRMRRPPKRSHNVGATGVVRRAARL